jgi:thioredoxin-like negative regulator of GroEL
MKKWTAMLAPIALAAGICGMLRADDSAPPVPSQAADSWQSKDDYVWWVEHQAAIAKDADAAGVQAAIEAKAVMGTGQPAIDFFTKALYDTKSRPVQRQIRLTLFDLYKSQGQNDKALDQLLLLMADQ